jgi:hypothetical protein
LSTAAPPNHKVSFSLFVIIFDVLITQNI